MGSPRLDPSLRIGRFLLDDCLRALGSAQWFLVNIDSGISEPMLAEMMAGLYHVGIVTLYESGGEFLGYRKERLCRDDLRPPLTRSSAEALLAKICAKAEELNRRADYYTFGRIFLFGSFLHGTERPNDLDIGLEIFANGNLIKEPSYIPFVRSEFQHAAQPLALRRPRHISVHHMKEMLSIGAPYQLVWSPETGRIRDGQIITPKRTSICAEELGEKLKRNAAQQVEFDELVERIGRTKSWPRVPVLNLGDAPDITREKWVEFRRNPFVRTLAHIRCLPAGKLRQEVTVQWQKMVRAGSVVQIAAARRWVNAYIKAGIRYTPWSLRDNGRLLKCSVRRM